MSDKIIALHLSEVKEMIKQRWRGRKIKTRPICVVGHTGVGKSQSVKQCSEELTKEFGQEVKCQVTNLQFMEPPDFCGLPFIDSEGTESISKHARPEILPTSGHGIWFLDEANRCNREMRQALITLIEDREVNGRKLGEGWIFVLAMNPSEADGVSYEVQEFDAALENRITKVEFKPNNKELISYLTKKYSSTNDVIRWITNQPDVIDYWGKKRTSPRGLEYLIRALEVDGGDQINFNTVAAEIGQEAAMTFKKFLSSPDYIKPEDIINRYNQPLADKIAKLEAAGRTDVLNSLVNGIVKSLEVITTEKVTKKQLKNIAKYLEDADADSRQSFFLALGEAFPEADSYHRIIDPLIQESPEIVKFLQKMRDLKEKKVNG